MDELRLCEYCGKEFIAHRKDSRFCSLSCGDKWHYRNNGKYVPHPTDQKVMPCSYCGKDFVPNPKAGNRVKYCSPECRRAVNSEQKRNSYISHPRPLASPRECVVCGKVFSPDASHPLTTTCSYKCHYQKRNREEAAERKEKREKLFAEGRKCPICGNTFIPTTHGKKYCSDKCRRKQVAITAKQNYTLADKERKQRSNFKKRWQGNYCKALARDNKTCQICGATESIEVHHINGMGEYRKMNGERILVQKADHSLKNLITLCSMCHRGLHNNLLVKHKGKWYIRGNMFQKLGLSGPIEIWDEKKIISK